uniref:Large ribosomal subunit protein bL25 n=1 Tax=candidate division WOR-3 bacterium TaxID=2052148 RepID=A0A7C6EK19_UNCW3
MKMELEAYLYEPQKKGDVRRMRMEGKIPGVLYGHKEKSKRIYVLKKEFEKVLETLKKETVTIELKLKEKTYPCLIKAIQHNPTDGRLLHIDFQHISKKEKIKATIPIHLIGEAPGVKKGGLLDQHLHEVVIRCLPDHLPSHIDVDISNLDIGKTIHLRDIAISNIEFEIKPETPVVSILAPKIEKEAPAPAAAPAEGAKEETKEEVKEEKPREEKAKEEKPAKEAQKEK